MRELGIELAQQCGALLESGAFECGGGPDLRQFLGLTLTEGPKNTSIALAKALRGDGVKPPASGFGHTPGFSFRSQKLPDRAILFVDGSNWYHALQ